ncbi:rod shape-determining protein MreD [Nocardioides panacisoli]|uniref:rod shape-determining protein MreD n=1 Tax=Nocardioides panacisoli TaxID=627624 RepID=UPI001C6263C0|nr:rod shape-determining protein MreD [Nocardioides panacisoli]QYJ04425.1 rod shape-determining protein MreD [Nocardioides panacisoli]
MTTASRLLAALAATTVAFLLQVTVAPHVAWDGVVPGLVLLVVVGAALATDARFATLLGFGAGLLLDVAPPADHAAGRWALALLVVGYVVGRLGHDHQPMPAGPWDVEQVRRLRRPPLHVVLAAALGGSFLGTSVFALTGLPLGETAGIGTMLDVVGRGMMVDGVAGLVVVPVTVWAMTRTRGSQRAPSRDPWRPSGRAVVS